MKPATYRNMFQVTVIGAMAVFFGACGGNKTQVGTAAPTTGKNALTGSNCTKDKCPPADLYVSANFAASGLLIGFAGEAVNWNFYGVDQNTLSADGMSSDRKVVVLLNNVPKGSEIFPAKEAGDLTNETRIDWIPDRTQRGKMEFIARDYERCLLNEDKATCNKYIFLKEYDRRFSDNAWEILDKDAVEAAAGDLTGGGAENVVNVSNPDCGNPTSQGAINASILKLGISVLQGGGLGAILPSLAGTLVNGGTSSGVNPTEC